METLADQLVLQAQTGSTPVLVLPRDLRFTTEFLVKMVRELKGSFQRKSRPEVLKSVRFDWLQVTDGLSSLWRDRVAIRHANSMTRELATAVDVKTLVQVTATVGRVNDDAADFVCGWATGQPSLPVWASPLNLDLALRHAA